MSTEQLYFYKGSEANLPKSGIKVGALYHCTDTKNTYIGKTATTMELWSSATSRQQLNGGVVIGEGNANGEYSIAGGTNDSSIVEDATGVDITSVSDSLIESELGPQGVRLKRLINNPAKAEGAGAISVGAGSQATTGMSMAIGAANQSGAKGCLVKSV